MTGNSPLFGSRYSAVVTSIVAMALLLLGMSCGRKNETKEALAVVQAYTVASYRNNASWSPDDSLWRPLSPELRISSGSWVETGSKSFAVLNGDIGDVVMLGERAKVCLSLQSLLNHTGNPIQRGVRLLKGIAHFNVEKSNSTFLVETPSAKIKVKGTSFLVSYSEEENSTDVHVENGEVEVVEIADANEGQTLTLSANEAGSGFGTENISKRNFDQQDSTLSIEFKEMLREMQERKMSDGPARQPDEIKKNLEHEMLQRSTSIDSNTASANAPEGTRNTGMNALQQEKQNYQQEKQVILEDHEEYKEEKKAELEAERDKARANLDDERSGRSRSAFDELKKRKEESKSE